MSASLLSATRLGARARPLARSLAYRPKPSSKSPTALFQPFAPRYTAVPRKKPGYEHAHETPEQVRAHPELQQVLSEHGVSADSTEPLGDAQKIDVLAVLSRAYDEPIPSNVLPTLRSMEDISDWFSLRTRPVGAMPHTRRFIVNTLQPKDDSVHDRMDLETSAVHSEFLAALPENLKLDRRTFRQAKREGLKQKVNKLNKLRYRQRMQASLEQRAQQSP